MPFYYRVNRATTTNASANTLSTHLRAATVANQQTAGIRSLYGAARFGTAGGAQLRLIRPGLAGTGGTANTPQKMNPNFRAADATWFDDTTAITAGTSPVTQLTIGLAQTGGTGGWMANEPDDGFAMLANGGANGNCELGSIANGTSVNFDVTVGQAETG